MTRFLTFCITALLLASCGDDTNSFKTVQPSDDYDRVACLGNMYDNIALPAFEDFQNKLELLEQSTKNYTNNPTDINLLNDLRFSWLEAYSIWQFVEIFSHYGKGEEILFGYKMNTYPTDTYRTSNIINGIAQFNPAFIDNQGFPALEYLIYGFGDSDQDIINNLNNQVALSLMNDIVTEMKNNTAVVYSWWIDNRVAIVEDNSSTATSSINLFINDFIYHYEKGFRTNKFGIPSGYFSSGQTFKEKTEGYFAGDISKLLALNSLQSISALFEGRSYVDNSIGESFFTYLVFLQEQELANEILNNFDEIKLSIQNLESDFARQIESNNDELSSTFDLIQSVVAKMKIDMTMAMGVGIDYISGDGD